MTSTSVYQKRDANSDYTFSLKSLSEWELRSKLVPLPSQLDMGQGVVGCEL